MSRVVDTVTPIIQPIVEAHDCQLDYIEYKKEGPHWYLRVYADKEGGIDLNDCARINEKISEALDAIKPDPFPKSYYLEVSSPGAERPFKNSQELDSAIGEYVHFDYYVPQQGEKFHEGTLVEVTEDQYIIEVMDKARKKEIAIDKDAISNARLAVQF